MKFGKRLENEAMPEWRSEYLTYKKLKKVIKTLNSDNLDEEGELPDDPTERNKIFIDALLLELDKVENFFLLQSDGAVRRKVHLTNQLEDLEKEKTITNNDGIVTDLPRTLTRTSDRSGRDEPRNSEKVRKSFREGQNVIPAQNRNADERSSIVHRRSSMFERMSIMTNKNTTTRAFLKNALLELYHLSTILFTFQQINIMAYTKIVKKFAKNRPVTPEKKGELMQHLYDSKLYSSEAIEKVIKELDLVFQQRFPTDPTYIKLKDFSMNKGTEHVENIYALPSKSWITTMVGCGFVAGILVGLNILLFISLCKIWSREDEEAGEFYSDHSSDVKILAFIYACIGLPIILLNGMIFNIFIWKFYKINYRLIFGTTHPILPIHFMILIEFYTFIYLEYVTHSLTGGIVNIPLQWQPLALIAIFLLFTYWPTNTLYMHSRYWWNDSFYRILLTPYYPIQFRDFFIADQWMSMTYFFAAIGWSFCYAITGDLPLNSSESAPSTTWYSIVLLVIPAWVRSIQCLRRYQMQYGNPSAYLQLVNFGKYMMSILTVVMIGVQALTTSNDTMFYCVFAIRFISTAYSLIWDFVMDFGLGQMRMLTLPTATGSSKKEKGKKLSVAGAEDNSWKYTGNPLNRKAMEDASKGGKNDLESPPPPPTTSPQVSERHNSSSTLTAITNSLGNQSDKPDENSSGKSNEASEKQQNNHSADEHQMMIYPLWYYYAILIADTTLRFLWVPLTFSVTYSGTLFFMYAIFEVIRRVSWNFFRVEIEHVHNCIAKRVIDTGSCPLPFVTQELYEPTPSTPATTAPPRESTFSRSSSRRDLNEKQSSNGEELRSLSVASTLSLPTIQFGRSISVTSSARNNDYPSQFLDESDDELVYQPHQQRQISRTISTASQSALHAMNIINTILTEPNS